MADRADSNSAQQKRTYARRLLSRWYPYEGLLYFHFLLAKLDSLGFLRDLPIE